jgi:acetylglutamate kinase
MHMSHEYAIPTTPSRLVVKYGGNAMPADRGSPDPILMELQGLRSAGADIVLVHGGGPEIDRALATRGIVTERIDGMRVTDAKTLEVTEAVLCGTINKRIVRACAALGLPAVGISGQDAQTLVARAMRASGRDLGYVGEIVSSNPQLLRTLLEARLFPVVAPLAISSDAAISYNVNADLAAAALAGALRAKAFVTITNVRRVLRDPNDIASGIERLSPAQARAFALDEACGAGMKPKVLAAALAVTSGATVSYICDAKPGAIAAAIFANDATIVA